MLVLLSGTLLVGQTAHFVGGKAFVGSGFSEPLHLAVDASGNLFVSDAENIAIYEIVAVNGTIPPSPTIRMLYRPAANPEGIAVDANGNVYFTSLDVSSNLGNNSVTEIVAVNGVIPSSPVVRQLGSGLEYPDDVAVDQFGNVYVSDSDHSLVKEFVAVNGSVPVSPTILTLGSGFSDPRGIAVDDLGNVYVSDFGSKQVEEILAVNGTIPASPTIVTLAGGFCGQWDIARDTAGDVFVADYCNAAIFEVPAANGVVQPGTAPVKVAGGFGGIEGVAVSPSGTLYAGIVSTAIPAITPSANLFGTANVGSTGQTLPETFVFDTGGTLGPVSVLTMGAQRMDFIDAGSGTCTPNTTYAAGQSCTVNVTFNPKFAGTRNGAVQLSDANGNAIATAYLHGTGVGPQLSFSGGTQTTLGSSFNFASGITVDGSGNAYVVDVINNVGNVQEIMAVTGSLPTNPTIRTLAGGLDCPHGPAMDAAGDVYFTDSCYHTVNEIQAANGSIPASPTVRTLTSQFTSPVGVAVDGNGNVYVLDASNNSVTEIYAVNGTVPASPTIATLASGFKEVDGLAVDGNGNVYVSDDTSREVFEVHAVNGTTPASPLITSLGSGFITPRGIAVDDLGNVYVAEYFYNTVYKLLAVDGSIPSSPQMQTLGAGLLYANGVALDARRNVFVADYGDARVVALDYADPPTLTFATTPPGSTSTDSPQTVTLENVGNADLSFPVPSTGSNPGVSANFIWDESSTCQQTTTNSTSPYSLAAGASCTLAIDFAPTTTGGIGGFVALTDNNLNAAAPSYAAQSMSLSGNGGSVPGAPSGVTATAGNDSATVSFTAPASNGGEPITSYSVTSSPGNFIVAVANSPAIVTGLTNGVTYIFTVTATNSLGAGPASAASNAVTPYGQQAITFNNPGTQYVGTSTTLSASASSGLPVTFSSTTTSVCTVTSGGMLTFVSSGTCSINADQAGNTTYSPAPTVTQAFSVVQPNLIVTTAMDDAGSASYCSVQSSTGLGTNPSCSLRDAALKAASLGAANIYFDHRQFGLAKAIILTNGPVTIPTNTTIHGATQGASYNLTNLVTVSGDYSTAFIVNSGAQRVSIANLIIVNGNSSTSGGAIQNAGDLTVTQCTFNGNQGYNGGAISSTGNLSVSGSAFVNNSALTGSGGGAIYFQGSGAVTNSTFVGNSGSLGGALVIYGGFVTVTNNTFSANFATSAGAIFSAAGLTANNNIFAGNIAQASGAGILNYSGQTANASNNLYWNNQVAGSEDDCNGCTTNINAVASSINPLSVLGSYGGPTQTMVPPPGSAAICAGSAALASGAHLTTDQRGLPLAGGHYCDTSAVDVGTVQTSYSLAFSPQPGPISPATSIYADSNFQAAVTLVGIGSPFNAAISIPLTLNTAGTGTLSNGTANTAGGVATYSNLQVSAPGTGDTLTAHLVLNPTATPAPSISVTSTAFNVLQNPTSVLASNAQFPYGPNAQNVTLTVSISGSGSTVNEGTVTFTVLSGGTPVGSAVSAPVVSGSASIAYVIPAATPAGTYAIEAAYSDGGGAFGPSSDSSHALTIVPAISTITWANPVAIGLGTALSSTQLDATSSVPGTFVYSPAAGAILSAGTQTLSVTFTPADTTDFTTATATVQIVINSAPAGLQFISVTPCRIVDTRNAIGPFGGPGMTGGSTREFDIPQSGCNIPSTAVAYSLNVTVVPNGSLRYLTMWPAGQTQPLVSTLNSDGRIKANAAIIPAGSNGGVDIYVTDPTQLVLDIDGYFVPAGTTSALAFYPVTPCRVADTRNATGALGGPTLSGGASRAFPVQSSTCGIPSTAQAYSLNVTAVPQGALRYLTMWPTGQTQPLVSTLNSPTGQVVANAAIVPAGTGGQVSVYVTDTSDVVVDIDGYFAPPGTGGLSLYTVSPCRVIDTRNGAGAFSGAFTVNVAARTCAPPSTAKGFVFNATVVPTGYLGYLTLWPNGATQPVVSTLNAQDGTITSNMAIVPTTNGSINAYATNPTNLVLDVSSYFAP